MIDIVVNNEYLEMPSKVRFTYTFQANDISDIRTRQASFSKGFKVPKTKHNALIFEGAGLVGSISTIPYKHNDVKVLENGIAIVKNGWLSLDSITKKYYNISIYSGVIGFFKSIANKTIGNDLDLTEINHNKNVVSVANSYDNNGLDYKYLFADYNGRMNIDSILIDYQIPSVRVSYLFNKIMTTYGYTYEGDVFSTLDYINLYITYPKYIPLDTVTTLVEVADMQRGLYNYQAGSFFEGITQSDIVDLYQWNNIIITKGNVISNWEYVVDTAGVYTIDLTTIGTITYYYENDNGFVVPGGIPNEIFSEVKDADFIITINGVSVVPTSNILSLGSGTLNLQVGDIVALKLRVRSAGKSWQNNYTPYEVNITSVDVVISLFDTPISFTDEFAKLKITDYIRELLVMFNLTIFVEGNHLKFYTLVERLQKGIVVDKSRDLKEVKKTNFRLKYAQRNYLKYKYNEKGGEYSNGSFDVDNENLKERKNLFQSIMYSAEEDKSLLPILDPNTSQTFFMNVFKFWDKEVTEDNNSIIDIEYKGLKDRFYFIRENIVNLEISVTDGDVFNNVGVTQVPFGVNARLSFGYFIETYYKEFKRILDDTKVINADIHINSVDVHNIDLSDIIYLCDTQNYYLINKIKYNVGRVANYELVRVKYSESEILQPINTIVAYITGYDGDCVYFDVTNIYDGVSLFSVEYFDGILWTTLPPMAAVSPICGLSVLGLVSGNNIRLRQVSDDKLSNIHII